MEDIATNTAAAKLAASSSPLPPSAKEGPVKSTKPPRWDPTIVPRTVDHTYTDYASVSDAELRKLDRDMSLSMLRSVDLTPEKKKLLEQLNEMPYKSGGSQSFPIRVCLQLNRCLYVVNLNIDSNSSLNLCISFVML